MPFVEAKSKKLHAVCDVCGYRSRYPRKDNNDVPKEWGGDKDYLLCSWCQFEYDDVESERLAAMAYDLR